jgi:hypothetical protein
MSTPQNASPTLSAKRRKVAAARGVVTAASERRVVTPRADLLVIKIGERYRKETVSPKEQASAVLARLGKVMSKPGVDRSRVFRSVSGKPVYAYSIDPKDTSKIVREDAAGRKIVGRVVNGKFRVIAKAG